MVPPRDEEGTRTRRFQLRPISRTSRKPREIVRRKKGLPQRELLPRGSLYCKQTACIGFENLGGEEGATTMHVLPVNAVQPPSGAKLPPRPVSRFLSTFFCQPFFGIPKRRAPATGDFFFNATPPSFLDSVYGQYIRGVNSEFFGRIKKIG